MNDISKNLIMSKYPLPIATFYKKVLMEERMISKGKSSYQTLFLSMIDLFEMINRFLAIIVVINYIYEGAFDTSLNKRLSDKLNKKLSLGDWQEILRETVKVFAKNDRNIFVPELKEMLFETSNSKKAKPKNILSIFDNLINIRNRNKGHGLNISMSQYESLCNQIQTPIEDILKSLSFLTQYQLISPIDVIDLNISFYQLYTGSAIQEVYNCINVDVLTKEGEILLIKQVGDIYKTLNLTPLSYFEFAYEAMESYLCFYEDLVKKNDTIKKLIYLGITPSSKNCIVSVEDQDAHKNLYTQFLKFILPFIKDFSVKTNESIKSEFKNYYFNSQIPMIKHYVKSFIGRQYVLEKIDLFMKNNDTGYMMLKGVPGQGKTAIMAWLVNEKGYVHHFISDDGGRNNENNMVCSLYYQISNKMGLKTGVLDERPEELKRNFGNLLFKFSTYCVENNIKEAIIIDALDELELFSEEIKLSYFPQYLPHNVFIILSSRNIPELKGISNRLDMEYELQELTYEETKKIISSTLPRVKHDIVLKIYNNTKGNSLFLKCILDKLAIENEISIDDIILPETFEELFRSFILSVRESQNNILIDILGLLVVAKNGLSVHELSEILSVGKYHIAKAIGHLYQFIVKTDNKFRIFHKLLIEILIGQSEYSFSKDEIKKYNQYMINYCLPYDEKQYVYAYKYLSYHYYDIDQLDAVVQLLHESQDFGNSILGLLLENMTKYSCAVTKPNNKICLLFDKMIECKNEYIYSILFEALEQGIYYGVYDFCLIQLEKMLKAEATGYFTFMRIKYLIAIIQKSKGNIETSMNSFKEISLTLNNNVDKNFMIKIYLEYANSARQFAMTDESIILYQKALELCSLPNDIAKYLDVMLNMCDIEYVRGNFIDAENNLLQGIMKAQQNGLKLQEANLKRILGQIYYAVEEFEKCVTIYEEALAIYSKLNDKVRIAKIYNNIAFSLVYLDLKCAKEYANMALELNREFCIKLEIAKSLLALSVINRREDNYKIAFKYTTESIELFKSIGYKSGIANSFHHLAILCLKNGDFQNAIINANNSDINLKRKKVPSYPVLTIKNNIIRSIAYELSGNMIKSQKALSNMPKINALDSQDVIINRFRTNILKEIN